jgi:hypothetical protein
VPHACAPPEDYSARPDEFDALVLEFLSAAETRES